MPTGLASRLASTGGRVLCLLVVAPLAVAGTVVSRLGDDDGFGLGLQKGDSRPASGGFFDERDGDDPPFTDTRPARPADPRSFSYEHTFDLEGRPIIGATLRLFTLGIQDGDDDVENSDKEILVAIDGKNIDGALDNVDQLRVEEETFLETAGTVSIPIPHSLLFLLEDGRATFRFRNFDIRRPRSGDAFAIDWSELVIETLDGLQVPGDCDQDSAVRLTDAICLFGFLFLGRPASLPCGDGSLDDAANSRLLDFDGNESVNLSDGVLLLTYLFRGGMPHALDAECMAIVGCPESCER